MPPPLLCATVCRLRWEGRGGGELWHGVRGRGLRHLLFHQVLWHIIKAYIRWRRDWLTCCLFRMQCSWKFYCCHRSHSNLTLWVPGLLLYSFILLLRIECLYEKVFIEGNCRKKVDYYRQVLCFRYKIGNSFVKQILQIYYSTTILLKKQGWGERVGVEGIIVE